MMYKLPGLALTEFKNFQHFVPSLILKILIQTSYTVIKVPYRYAVQVSDTTMMPMAASLPGL